MNKSIRIIHWLPRVLCILAILFVSIFAFDAFSPDRTLLQQLGAFLVHLIPSFLLLALLVVAWKWEFAGGIIFTIIGLAFSPVVFTMNYRMNHSVWMSLGIIASITIPFVIVGIMFIVSHEMKKKHRQIIPDK